MGSSSKLLNILVVKIIQSVLSIPAILLFIFLLKKDEW